MSLSCVAPSPRHDAVAEDAALKIMGELAVLWVNDFRVPSTPLHVKVEAVVMGRKVRGNLRHWENASLSV